MSSNGAESAAETTKQIIALSTGLIGLTVTFADKFRPAPAIISVPCELKLCWLALGVTVAFGVWTLMAITGEVNQSAIRGPNIVPDADRPSIRIPAILMVLSFLAGIGLAIAAGFSRFG